MKSPHPKLLLLLLMLGLALNLQAQNRQQSSTPEARMANWLRDMDMDGDKKISSKEATALMKKNFSRIDGNNDGFLVEAELSQLANRLSRNGQRPQNQRGNNRRAMSTEQLLETVPKDVVVEPDIAYRKGNSEAWKLDLVMPKSKSKEARAAIVFVHGGGFRAGDKRSGYFLRGAIEYAQKGYVCITVNYRLTGEAPLPACIEDVKCAVRWLRANAKKYNVNPRHIGAYGNSAGAHLACMLGLVKPSAGMEGDGPYQDQSSLVQAVCASATPTSFVLDKDDTTRRGLPGAMLAGPAETLLARATATSPATYVSADAPPILLVHGAADTTVNVKHSDTFHAALKKADAKHLEYIRVDGAGHGVFHQASQRTFPAMEAFFKKHLLEGEK